MATAAMFTSVGYDRLTIEGIAAAAKVGKQTIYRWWPNRASLVAECLLEGRLFAPHLSVPSTNDIRRDLTSWLASIVSEFSAPDNRGLFLSLIAAAADDESVGQRLHEALADDVRFSERVARAVAAGQLPPVSSEALGEALLGVVTMRMLARRELDATTIARAVDLVLYGPAGP